MAENEIVKKDLDDLPPRPPEAEVVRETTKKIKLGSREMDLPTDITFADGSYIKINYKDVGRKDPDLDKCMYCDGLEKPRSSCPVCHGTGQTVPMQLGKPMDLDEFEGFAQDDMNGDFEVMAELKKVNLNNIKELERLTSTLAVYRPSILETLQPAFDEIKQKLLPHSSNNSI